MQKRGLTLVCEPIDPDCIFAGEAQEPQEIVGNVFNNACEWARRAVDETRFMLGP